MPKSPTNIYASSACLLVLLPLLPGTGRAAWDTVPEISLSAETDDNVLLADQNRQSVSRFVADANVRLSNFNQRGSIYIEPRVVFDSYPDSAAKVYESDDKYFRSGGNYGWQTVSVGFYSNYSEQLLLNSEFEEALPDDPDAAPEDEFTDPDTGRIIFFDETRKRFDLSGNLALRLSERNSFRFDAWRQDVSYSGQQTTSRSDFDANEFAMSIVRRTDERNTVSARIFKSAFSSELNDNSTDSVGIEGRFTRGIAPTWTMNMRAGVQRSDYDFLRAGQGRVDGASSDPTFGIGFRKRSERTQWNIDFGHRVQPQGNGYLSTRREMSTYMTRQFTQRLGGRVGLVFTETETLDDVQTADNRDYLRVNLGIEWAIKQTLFLTAGLDRIEQEFVNENSGQRTSNGLFVGITYRGLSRQNQ